MTLQRSHDPAFFDGRDMRLAFDAKEDIAPSRNGALLINDALSQRATLITKASFCEIVQSH